MRLAILSLWFASVASGAIAADSTSSASLVGTCSGGGCSRTWTHTIDGTADRRLLIVMFGGSGAASYDSVTIDGVAFTVVPSTNGQIWYYVNPPAGAHTLVATWGGPMTHSFDSVFIAAVALSGVNQDNPLLWLDNSQWLSGLSNPITTAVANEWIVGLQEAGNANTVSLSTTGTKFFDGAKGSNYMHVAAMYGGPVSAGVNTVTFTQSGGDGNDFQHLIAIKPFTNIPPVFSGGDASSVAPSRPLSPGVKINQSYFTGAGVGGDTEFCTWTSATTRAGNWNGGSIVCTYNDGDNFGCGTSNNICIYSLDTYVPGTSATMSLVNRVTSYGSSSATTCYDTIHQMKSRKPFSLPGLIFLPIFCMTNGSPFFGYQSGFIVSPDGGAHWCNLKTFRAGGNAGANSCDAGNWQATGDNPVDAAGFQWPLADGTNLFTRMALVDFLCQDNTVNCPIATGVDPAYIYAVGSKTDSSGAYVGRALKSLGKLIMLPENWTFYQNGSWVADAQTATDTGGAAGCCGSVSYLKNSGMFVTLTSTYADVPMQTAAYPWGPWTNRPNIAYPDARTGFPSFIAGLCPTYSAGRVVCTMFGDAGTGLSIRETDLGPIGPFWR